MCHIWNKFANWMINRINLVKSSSKCFQIFLEFAIHASRAAARTNRNIYSKKNLIDILVRFRSLIFLIFGGTLIYRLLVLLQFLNFLFFYFFNFLLKSSFFIFQLLFWVLFLLFLFLDLLCNFFTEILNIDILCLHLDNFLIRVILFLPLKQNLLTFQIHLLSKDFLLLNFLLQNFNILKVWLLQSYLFLLHLCFVLI